MTKMVCELDSCQGDAWERVNRYFAKTPIRAAIQ